MSRKYRAISLICSAYSWDCWPRRSWQGKRTQPAGKLVLFGDLNAFAAPTNPDNCTARNRFKKGETLDSASLPLTEEQIRPRNPPKVMVHISFRR